MKDYLKNLSTAVRLLAVGIVMFSIIYPILVGVGGLIWRDSSQGSLIRDENGVVVGSELIGQEFDSPEFFHSRPSSIDYNAMKSGSQNLAPQLGALFRVDSSGIENSLNQGIIPGELSDEFDRRSYSLRSDFAVVKEGNGWMIEDNGEELYIIREDNEDLEIYRKSKLRRRVENILEEFSSMYDNEKVPSVLVTESGSALDPHITVRSALFQVPRVSQNTNVPEEKLQSVIEEISKDKFLGLYGMKRINVLKLNLKVKELMEEY